MWGDVQGKNLGRILGSPYKKEGLCVDVHDPRVKTFIPATEPPDPRRVSEGLLSMKGF